MLKRMKETGKLDAQQVREGKRAAKNRKIAENKEF